MKKKRDQKYHYGKCEICDTPMHEKRIKQDFWIKGQLIVVDNVSAGVCPQCGEKVVRAGIGRKIMELLNDTERITQAPKISVPSIRLETEEMSV